MAECATIGEIYGEGFGMATRTPYRGRGHGTKTPEICAEIIERMSVGETLSSICREERMPTVRSVNKWMAEDAEFESGIARARALGYDCIADDCLRIADDSRADEDVQRSKLRVWTRLQLLAKWDPKRYGERLQHTGEGGGPIQVNFYIPDNGRDKTLA